MCVWCVCVCVCLSLWYVILEHEVKNVRAELIWRVLIATIKTPIHISQSKFSFQSLKHTIIYTCGALKTGTVEGEADMETVSCAFSLLCLILYMSGWSEVENEQRSGCGEWASGVDVENI